MSLSTSFYNRLISFDSSGPKKQTVIRDLSLVFVTRQCEVLPTGSARFAPEKGMIIEIPDKGGNKRKFKVIRATPVADLPVLLVTLDEIEKD